MRAIREYAIASHSEEIMVPAGARILSAFVREGEVLLSALVNPEADSVARTFTTFLTNETFDESSFKSDYIGSVVFTDGRVGHVVEIV